jgi:hypothetical protein
VTYFFCLIEYNSGEVMKVGQTVYADVLFLINFSMDFLVYIFAQDLPGAGFIPSEALLPLPLAELMGSLHCLLM